ncbi:hypothetical protein GCM10010211_57810 [Streptomyces albospinus]|uniref:Uncharacterized protein n=1 Tax=Streptomyces albospinus TaxID=285515 RepID=A0ABQ2VFH3_9ACTN|nr:hypothetical protein GCM10010211_57810 [Streptomyces albospinus]
MLGADLPAAGFEPVVLVPGENDNLLPAGVDPLEPAAVGRHLVRSSSGAHREKSGRRMRTSGGDDRRLTDSLWRLVPMSTRFHDSRSGGIGCRAARIGGSIRYPRRVPALRTETRLETDGNAGGLRAGSDTWRRGLRQI